MSTLSVSAAASYCGRSRSTIFRLIHAGELRAVRVGNRFLVDTADLDAVLAPQPVIPRNPQLPPDILGWAREVARTAPPLSAEAAAAIAGILRGVSA